MAQATRERVIDFSYAGEPLDRHGVEGWIWVADIRRGGVSKGYEHKKLIFDLQDKYGCANVKSGPARNPGPLEETGDLWRSLGGGMRPARAPRYIGLYIWPFGVRHRTAKDPWGKPICRCNTSTRSR